MKAKKKRNSRLRSRVVVTEQDDEGVKKQLKKEQRREEEKVPTKDGMQYMMTVRLTRVGGLVFLSAGGEILLVTTFGP